MPSGIPVRALAEEEEITAAQLALAWPLAKGDDIAPIPGTCSATRVEENARAADIELTAADIERIHNIVPTAQSASATPKG